MKDIRIILPEPQAVALCNNLNELDYNPDACDKAIASFVRQVQKQADFSHDR